jgi:hypothetical protein
MLKIVVLREKKKKKSKISDFQTNFVQSHTIGADLINPALVNTVATVFNQETAQKSKMDAFSFASRGFSFEANAA